MLCWTLLPSLVLKHLLVTVLVGEPNLWVKSNNCCLLCSGACTFHQTEYLFLRSPPSWPCDNFPTTQSVRGLALTHSSNTSFSANYSFSDFLRFKSQFTLSSLTHRHFLWFSRENRTTWSWSETPAKAAPAELIDQTNSALLFQVCGLEG